MKALQGMQAHGPHGPFFRQCLWNWYGQLPEEDLKAMFAYLKSIPAIPQPGTDPARSGRQADRSAAGAARIREPEARSPKPETRSPRPGAGVETDLMSFRTFMSTTLVAFATLMTACGGGESTVPSGGGAAEPPPPLPGESTISGRVTLNGTVPEARVIKCVAVRSDVHGRGGRDSMDLSRWSRQRAPECLPLREGGARRAYVSGAQDRWCPIRSAARYHTARLWRPGGTTGGDHQQRHHDPQRARQTQDERRVQLFADGQGQARHAHVRQARGDGAIPVRRSRMDDSYGGVVAHPFFAVSNDTGHFEIKGLPSGTFTIEAWHEQLGVQTQMVTVDGKSGASTDFVFAGKTK